MPDTMVAPPMQKNDESTDGTGHTRVYLIDDHPPIRDAIAGTLADTIDLELCGESAGLDDARDDLDRLAPDVAVVDISLTDRHGLHLVKDLRSTPVETLVYSMYDETVYAERALRAGAGGYLMKTEPPGKLVDAIRCIERGETYLSPAMTSRILGGTGRGASDFSFAIDELTDREREVFELLGRGKEVEEIQEELGLNRKTVETYRRRAKEKLGVDNVSELLQYAMQWIQGPTSEDGTVDAPSRSADA